MNYERPEIISMRPALRAVKGTEKGSHPALDSEYVTMQAYEADE